MLNTCKLQCLVQCECHLWTFEELSSCMGEKNSSSGRDRSNYHHPVVCELTEAHTKESAF